MAKTEFDYNDKLSFLGEWFDYQSYYHKKFILNFYPSDNTLDIFDRELNRMYLKRTRMDNLGLDDMFVGNKIRIYGRQITITDYADCRTQKFVGKAKEHTLAILKPNVVDKLGEIITQIQDRKFHITRLRMCELSRKEALDFYEHKKGDAALPFVLENIVSGPSVALELVGENALARWKEVMGPADPQEARKTAPDTLVALYGLESPATNGFHGSDTPEDAVREINFFFPKDSERSAPETPIKLQNTTCCIIKPHAVQEGKLGYIISFITDSHFKITAAKMTYLSNANADEFLEVYKGIVSDYHALLLSFLDGPCVVLEIGGKNEEMNVHQEFRNFAGPPDSDIARQIRPNSLRANFGCDKYSNAVHCTDLLEDTAVDLEYLFRILKD
ncbi:nucleoside diphosphate kinase 7 [Anoplophora glabripennis]|uniref:nucleoside diphosphate kinase 7 n=1 Tax=Anoplophora glabripennis TaxID=217634 RepID=UPI00087541EC|nr:nucleoside diphosphate kinase 7 [Anoplophora glabripennis]